MKKRTGEKNAERKESLKDIAEKKTIFMTFVYIVLSVYAVVAVAMYLPKGEYKKVFGGVLTLAFFAVPGLIEKMLKMEFPPALKITIILFIFGCQILGEVHCFYLRGWHWDKLMHATSGFIFAALGYALFNIHRQKEPLPPLYLAAVAVCFSIMVAVLWEFYEFGADRLLAIDMQKDTVINTISSVMLDPTNSNVPVVVKDIADVAVNGESFGFGGYLDIGLFDTMGDLFANTVGALVFYIVVYIETKTKRSFLHKIVPIWRDTVEPDLEAVEEKVLR